MKAALKHLHSPDVDLRDYRPELGDNFLSSASDDWTGGE
jgi:hypothetical protein